MPDQRDLRDLEELLGNYDTALLTTLGSDGHFHTRPMAMQQQATTGEGLWFASRRDTDKVHDLQANPSCGVTLYSRSLEPSYVSLSGRGRIESDRTAIHRRWDPGWSPWFPDGPDTKDLVLIRFQPEHVEYVHPGTGALKVLFTVARPVGARDAPPKQQVEVPESIH